MDGAEYGSTPIAGKIVQLLAMKLHQSIRFCTSTDGTQIAIASVGSGPVLLRAPHWLTHAEYDLESPVWRPWLDALSVHNTYVRFDQRGSGLSDRNPANISFDAWIADMEAVAETIEQTSFPILAMSQGGAMAIEFASRHPQRVSHLILYGAYGRGQLCRGLGEHCALEAETMVNLIRVGWGHDDPAFRQLFTQQFIPDGTVDQHRWWTELQRISASPEIAARTLEKQQRIDVSAVAERLNVPTLVMHARHDRKVPFEEGRRLAAIIPNARFVPLESNNHVLLPTEPAWAQFHFEIRNFLDPASDDQRTAVMTAARLTGAEAKVLALVASGLDNRVIALRLGKSEKTVRNQVSTILDKLGVRSRSEAIVRALAN